MSPQVDALLDEIELLAHKFAKHGQLRSIRRIFAPFYNNLRDLKGLNKQALVPLDSFTTTDEFQDSLMGINDYVAFEAQLMIDIAHSFMLRDIMKAQSFADMFEGVLTRKQRMFNYVIIEFYAGLAASQFARETIDEDWKAKAGMVRDSLEELCSHSKWNFENKLFLLRAECHYTEGEMSQAAKTYKSAITSARNHKLVHEEAMACELAGYFFKDQKDESTSTMMFAQAHKAYMKWGAVKKAKAVLQMLSPDRNDAHPIASVQ
jgi:ATP-dependent RNA helicase DDX31/DBP7